MTYDSGLRTQRGFTLVEMIVAIFIFSVVMIIATGALVNILDANRKAQTEKSVINNLNFALDSMTRAIRVGTDYNCGVSNCATTGSTQFLFNNADGNPVTYRFNQTAKQIERSINGGSFLTVTAPEVQINTLQFYADGISTSDGEQPRVLIILEGQSGEKTRTKTTFSIETLVTQRLLDR